MFVPHLKHLSMMLLIFTEVFPCNNLDILIILSTFLFIELLRKPVLDIEPDAVRKLKMFYQTCIGPGKEFIFIENEIMIIIYHISERDSPTNENITYHLLLQHLERFGGFPPLHGHRWQSKIIL